MDCLEIPPKAVQNLLCIANLKAMAHKAYIQEMKQNGQEVKITMFERAKVNPAGFPPILEKFKNNLTMRLEETPYFMLSLKGRRPKESLDVLEVLGQVLKEFQGVIME